MNAILELNEQKYNIFLSEVTNNIKSDLFFLTFYTKENINKDIFLKQKIKILNLNKKNFGNFYIVLSYFDKNNYKYILIGKEEINNDYF